MPGIEGCSAITKNIFMRVLILWLTTNCAAFQRSTAAACVTTAYGVREHSRTARASVLQFLAAVAMMASITSCVSGGLFHHILVPWRARITLGSFGHTHAWRSNSSLLLLDNPTRKNCKLYSRS